MEEHAEFNIVIFINEHDRPKQQNGQHTLGGLKPYLSQRQHDLKVNGRLTC